MSDVTVWAPGELVPLSERLRVLLAFRLVAAGVVAGVVAVIPPTVWEAERLLLVAAAYVAAAAVVELGWRWQPGRGRLLIGAALLVDGAFLAASCYGTGGDTSPLRFLVLLHLIAVALLASYRTGLKIALWHSLLLLVVHHAERADLLAPGTPAGTPGTSTQRLLVFVVTFWLVALATATFSALNERELRRRRHDLEALAALATRLETAGSGRAVGAQLAAQLRDAGDFPRVLVLEHVDGEELPLAAAPAAPAGALPPGRSPVLRRALSEHRTLRVSAPPPGDPLTVLLPGVRNLLVVPMYADGRPLGAVVAEHGLRRGSAVERRVVSIVERFAAPGGLALANARLVERLRSAASRDGLTGIANRRSFDAAVPELLAAPDGRGVTLLLVDVDHFKRVNDDHGHLAGDEVLRGVADVLRVACAAAGQPFRYGGEEFAVLLPGLDRPQAVEAAEALRTAVRDAATAVPVTVSIGLASSDQAGTVEGLVALADAALYDAKRGGRDRVCAAAAARETAVALPDQRLAAGPEVAPVRGPAR